jgi:ABC-type transport system involved in multi-copper enzyme maturation permease subunit
MRRFLILMGREIRDQFAFFIGSAAFAALLTPLVISTVMGSYQEIAMMVTVTILLPAAVLLTFFLCGFGAAQMVSDRTKNLSAFLTVLPVTRGQIFLARLAVGVLWILVSLVPLTITGAIILKLRVPPGIPMYRGLLPDLFVGAFLTYLACYSCGLYSGWRAGAPVLWLAILPFAAMLPLLIVIKGFGLELVVVLLFFIAACLIATWQKYSRSSL